ncbi:MAG: hypothetical protein ACYDBB_16495 [Armatimonadota bacterium]
MEVIEGAERRKHVRLHYPEEMRPVVEISREGLVFWSTDMDFRLRKPFFAFVKFADGEVVSIEGTIVRMKVDLVIALCLTKGFTPERVTLEVEQVQAYLRKHPAARYG